MITSSLRFTIAAVSLVLLRLATTFVELGPTSLQRSVTTFWPRNDQIRPNHGREGTSGRRHRVGAGGEVGAGEALARRGDAKEHWKRRRGSTAAPAPIGSLEVDGT